MNNRLTELSHRYHTHPDEGGDYLSLAELNELCTLQHAEIKRLRINSDELRTVLRRILAEVGPACIHGELLELIRVLIDLGSANEDG